MGEEGLFACSSLRSSPLRGYGLEIFTQVVTKTFTLFRVPGTPPGGTGFEAGVNLESRLQSQEKSSFEKRGHQTWQTGCSLDTASRQRQAHSELAESCPRLCTHFFSEWTWGMGTSASEHYSKECFRHCSPPIYPIYPLSCRKESSGKGNQIRSPE